MAKENYRAFLRKVVNDAKKGDPKKGIKPIYSNSDFNIFFQRKIIETKKAIESGKLSKAEELIANSELKAYTQAKNGITSKAPEFGKDKGGKFWTSEYELSSHKGAKIVAGVAGAALTTAAILALINNGANKPAQPVTPQDDPVIPISQEDPVENRYADNIGKPVHYEHTRKDGTPEALDGHEFVVSEAEVAEVGAAEAKRETPEEKFIGEAVDDGVEAGSTKEQAIVDAAEAINAPEGIALNVEADDELTAAQAIEEIDTLGQNLEEGLYALSGKWSFRDRNSGNYVASFFAENGKEALAMAQAQGLDVSNYELFAAIVRPENLIPYWDATAAYHADPNAKVSYTEDGETMQIIAGAQFVKGWVSATDATRVADLAWIDTFTLDGKVVVTGEMLGERSDAYAQYNDALAAANDGAEM